MKAQEKSLGTAQESAQEPRFFQSEDEILACIHSLFPNKHKAMPLGRGDDCAVMATAGKICVSTDLFLEDVHFRRSYFTPEEIGHKALAVNVSDIAAMGAKPLAFSLGLMLPKDVERGYVEAMLGGMAALASRYDLALSGGDISRAASLGFSITIYGEAQGISGEFLQRGQCREGDIVFVIGDVGLARVGLLSMEDMGREACSLYPAACQAHLLPRPLVEAGTALASYHEAVTKLATINLSLMDLSDGLARDLTRLLGSGNAEQFGADIELKDDMLHAELLAFAHAELSKDGIPSSEDVHKLAIYHAFMGGEDYGLLGTCPPEHFDGLSAHLTRVHHGMKSPQVHRLGVVTRGPLRLNGRIVNDAGFDHFAQKA